MPYRLALLLAFVLTACQAGPPPQAPQAAEKVTQTHDRMLALVEGNRIIVQVVRDTECQWVLKGLASGWRPCGSTPVPQALIRLNVNAVTLEARTSASGEASFDLQELAGVRSRPAQASLSLRGTAHQTTVSLLETPFYAAWENERADQEERRRLERQAGQVTQEIERPTVAQEASLAQEDTQYQAQAWEALRSQLIAPSSARLLDQKVLLRCPKGRIIALQFDGQNRLGTMLRGTGVVKINQRGQFNARIEGERLTGLNGEIVGDPFVVLIQAAQRGDCSDMR